MNQLRSGWLMLAGGVLAGLGIGAAFFYALPGSEPASAETGSIAPGQVLTSDSGLPLAAPVEGALAPEFELLDLDGVSQRLSDLRGSIVLLNFWATWCGPCEAEMPMLNEAYRRYQEQGLIVLAVNFDEARATVEEFSDRLGLEFPVLLDPGGTVQALYRVRGYPTSFLVDRDGVIRVEHIGLLSEAKLTAYLAEMGLDEP